MIPPHCNLCDARPFPATLRKALASKIRDLLPFVVSDPTPTPKTYQDFGLVQFTDYKALPEGMMGHPDGWLWFCSDHIEEATGLSHCSSTEALRILRRGRWLPG